MNNIEHSKNELKPSGSRKEYYSSHRFATQMYAEPDPMLSILEWLYAKLMEAEVPAIVGPGQLTSNHEKFID